MARYFFSEKRASEASVVYLALDEEILPQIAEEQIGVALEVESACRDFVEAIRSKWVDRDQIIMPQPKQKDDSGSPLHIAFLGFLVLAASKMDDDERSTDNNYYLRLNELLFNEGREHSPQGFDYDLHVALWDDLQDWLLGRGLHLVLPTQRKNPYFSVKFIKSQALLRVSDLFKMTYLFNNKNLYPGQRIKDDHLENLVSEWLSQTDCPISSHAKRVLKGQRKLYAWQQIAYYLQNWDGSFPHDPQSADLKAPRTLAAHLNVNIRGHHGRFFELCYYLKCPDQWEERVTKKLDLVGDRWYGPLQDCLSLDSFWSNLPETDIPIRLRPTNKGSFYYVLSKNFDSALIGFMAKGQHHIGDEILVLAKASGAGRIGQVLQQLNKGTEVPAFPNRPELPEGWMAFRPFTVQCQATNCPPELEQLQPSHESAIRLEGGLKLDRRDWLKGVIPRIKICGASPTSRITINNHKISLDEFGYARNAESLIVELNEYCVQLDGQLQRSFSLKSPQWPFSNARLGENSLWQFKVLSDKTVKPTTDTDEENLPRLQISGALVEGNLPDTEKWDETKLELDFKLPELIFCEHDIDSDWFVVASSLAICKANPLLQDMMMPQINSSVRALGKSSIFYKTLLKSILPHQKVKFAFALSHLQLLDEAQERDVAK